jgi:hypothetical protein
MPVLNLRLDPRTYNRLERIAQRECRTECSQVLYVLQRWLQRAPQVERVVASEQDEEGQCA